MQGCGEKTVPFSLIPCGLAAAGVASTFKSDMLVVMLAYGGGGTSDYTRRKDKSGQCERKRCRILPLKTGEFWRSEP